MCIKMHIPLNERGYTFVEALLQLVVTGLFASFFIIVTIWTGYFHGTAFTKEHTEWELFVHDLLQYMTYSQHVEVINNGKGIRIMQHEQFVHVETYKTLIRKRVDGQGHEPMLMNVRTVEFVQDGTKLTLIVEFLNGLRKERQFVVPIRIQ